MFEGIPYLYDNALNLSSAELQSFFEHESDYLDKTFGITTLEQLNNILINIAQLKSKELKYVEINESSIMYNTY